MFLRANSPNLGHEKYVKASEKNLQVDIRTYFLCTSLPPPGPSCLKQVKFSELVFFSNSLLIWILLIVLVLNFVLH